MISPIKGNKANDVDSSSQGFLGGLDGKESTCEAVGTSLIP